MKIFDISPTISSDLGVFPGDCQFSRQEVLSFSKGHHLALSNMTTTMHIGAHADAPNHYDASGVGISERSLDIYLGPCQVIRVDIRRGQTVTVQHLEDRRITQTRILFYTGSFPDPYQWNSDFCSLSAELVRYLSDHGVKLVGIDTPSIDPEDSKELEAHHQVFASDMAILEGLVLEDIPEGNYQLIALPLKIKDSDASPVRAVLTEL